MYILTAFFQIFKFVCQQLYLQVNEAQGDTSLENSDFEEKVLKLPQGSVRQDAPFTAKLGFPEEIDRAVAMYYNGAGNNGIKPENLFKISFSILNSRQNKIKSFELFNLISTFSKIDQKMKFTQSNLFKVFWEHKKNLCLFSLLFATLQD